GRWNLFTTADIDLFHVEFRSLFDYVARLLRGISDRPKNVPDDRSFEALGKWIAKPGNGRRIGEEVADLIKKANWFGKIKEVRDEIVHRGGETLVFFEKPHILFQTYKRHEKLLDLPGVMYNPNVVDFELYASVLYAYLIDYLEDM